MRALFVLAFICVSLSACVSTNAAVLDPTLKFQKICPDGVQIFTSSDKVMSDYHEVAMLNSKGESGWTDERGMMGSQRRKAASLGANGIVLGDIKEPNAGTKIIGAIFGTGSERHGRAVAIYIPADSERVKEACGRAPAVPQLAAGRRAVGAGAGSLAGATGAAAFGSPPPVSRETPVWQPSPEPRPAPITTLTMVSARDTVPSDDGVLGYSVAPERAPPTAAPIAPSITPPVTRRAPGRLPPVETPPQVGRFNADLLRFAGLRQALDDLMRLQVVSEFQEVRFGILKLMVGPGFSGGTSTEYNLSRLYSAYREATAYDGVTALELWQNGWKIGEYAQDGLLLGAAYSAPR